MKLENILIYNTERRQFLHGCLSFENGIITKIEYSGKTAEGCKKVIPGLIDVHTHGRAGIDIMAATEEELITLSASYAALGTTTVFPTVMTAPQNEIEAALKRIRAASKNSVCNFDGVHIEGPYISAKRPGCHTVSLIRKPCKEEITALADMIHPLKTHVTLAPEEDRDEAVSTCVSHGITVGIGHSDATYKECIAAIEKGACTFTHTFNAMRPLLHREPGCVGAALASDLFAEFIADGFHLDESVIALSYKAKGNSRFVLITDSIAAAGMPDGKYTLAGIPVNVNDGKILTDDGTIAGSSLDMVTALKNLMSFTGASLEEALPCATENPAKQVGIFDVCGSIQTGKRADLVILAENEPFTIENVAVGGKFLY